MTGDRSVRLFLQECGPLMASERAAMKTGNASRFAYDIHTLRGMFRNLSATAAQEAAEKLEELSLKTDREKAEATYALKKPRLGAGVAYLHAHREGWRACRQDSVHDNESNLRPL